MADITRVKLPNNDEYNLKDAYKSGIYTVIGTQTAATGSWTGALHGVSALYDGLTIMYYLPWAGSGNATLNLTLDNGTTTGAVNCYYGNTTRLTTHYAKGCNIVMTYWSAGSIKIDGTATLDDRWIANANFIDGNDQAYNVRAYYNKLKTGPNKIFPYTYIMQVADGRWESIVTSSSTGTSKTRNTHGFRLGQLALMYANATYYENDIVADATVYHAYTSGLADHRYSFNTANNSTSGTTANKPIYLVGSIGNDGLFYLDTTWWTQTLPTTSDNKLYIYLGDAYDYYRMDFVIHHPIYHYSNGMIREYSQDSGTVNGHTVGVDVPANAVFTDNNDAVAQTPTNTTNADYRVLMSSTADDSQHTEGTRKDSAFKYNPYYNKLYTGCIEAKESYSTLKADSVFDAPDNTKIVANASALIQSPIPKYLWHDVFAFCRVNTPTYYVSTDNSTWTEDTLDKRHFANKDNLSITVIKTTGQTGARWVWNSAGFQYCMAAWLVIGVAYSSTAANVTILFESSADGTTWTTRHTSTHQASSNPIWCKVKSNSADAYLRLTLTKDTSDTTGTMAIGAIKLLTPRWGNQGQGSELEYPYTWDENGVITPMNNGSSPALGTSSLPWRNGYFTNINGVAVGNSPKFTDTTYTGTGAISVDASTHVISTTAEVNQNAFSNVKVGSTTIQADSKTDTLELVAGTNITLTPDATNDKITIDATGGGGTSIIPSGYCDTAGGTAAKVCQLDGFTNTANQWFLMVLVNANTYAGELSLDVNGTGALPLYIDGAISSASNYTLPAGVYAVGTSDGAKYSLRTDGKTPINISGKAALLEIPRSTGNANSLGNNTDRLVIREFGSTASNIPTSAYYYVISMTGDDTDYCEQIAIGETNNNIWFRQKASNTWTAWRPLLYLNNVNNSLFQVLRGTSMSTNTAGYWAAMLNNSQAGSPTLPAGGWWHVISMDWNDATIGSTGSTNWMSQLAVATKDGNGVWYRKNTASTSIESATWNRLAEGDSSGNANNALKVNNLTVQTAVPANAVFTDAKVKVTHSTNNSDYPVCFESHNNTQEYTTGIYKTTKVTVNPTGILKITDSSSRTTNLSGGYLYINGNPTLVQTLSQALWIGASGEDDYKLFLGVHTYNSKNYWTFMPAGDNKLRLGMPDKRWNQIYSSSSTISTSDRKEKKDIVPLDETAKDFIMALNPVSYKFINGESGRTHYGMIAQDVEEEMAELGMTPMDFAGFCKDQKVVTFKDEEDRPKTMPVEGEYTYGLRYEEFLPAVIKTVQLQQQEIDELKSELAELKALLLNK